MDDLMFFEVERKQGKGWIRVGTVRAADSAKAAGQAGFIRGAGTYRVRPEDSRDSWFAYRVTYPAPTPA